MPPAESVPPGRCGAKTRGGGSCTQWPIRGTKRCRMHSGRAGRAGVKAKGAVVVELARWGLGDSTVDPGEVLLRLVTQSAARVEMYSGLLQQAYAAAERLQASYAAHEIVLLDPEERFAYTPAGDEVERPEPADRRSEEHTSELQSQSNLVCRLLLEKKKKRHT